MIPTIPRRRSLLGLLALTTATGGLVWAGPRPGDVPHSGAALADWLTSTPVDQSIATLAGLAAELCLLWFCLGAVLVCLGRLPGLVGRLSEAIAVRVTPQVVRRAVEAALGAAVATASTAVTATPALAAAPMVAGFASTRPSAPAGPSSLTADMGWVSAATPTPVPPLPSLDRPASPPAASSRPLQPLLAPDSPVADPAVVVRRGDSLWAIAARHLGSAATEAQIAAAWPRWYAANRAVIGPDPDLLLPGQRLLPPANPSTTTTADRSPG